MFSLVSPRSDDDNRATLARISSAVFVPHEGFGVFVAEADVFHDGRLERARAAMHATAKLLLGQQRKPRLDQIDPGGSDSGEAQMKAGTFRQPPPDPRRLMPDRATAWLRSSSVSYNGAWVDRCA